MLCCKVKNYLFIIQEDKPEVGAYIYKVDIESKKSLEDYLQDSVENCIEFALEHYNIEANCWKECSKSILSLLSWFN